MHYNLQGLHAHSILYVVSRERSATAFLEEGEEIACTKNPLDFCIVAMMNRKHTAGKTKAKHNCTSDEQMPLKLGQGMILLKEGLYQEGPR